MESDEETGNTQPEMPRAGLKRSGGGRRFMAEGRKDEEEKFKTR